MVQLWGRAFTKRELLERIGDVLQVAGAECFTYTDGNRDGVRAVRVRSGGGLDFTVLLSRGMDIAGASYHGVPFAWQSATGQTHPHALESQGRGWLRTFHGGLLTGCGLSNAGAANDDVATGESLGIHGYLSHLPAEATWAGLTWRGDEADIVVRGTLREARVFGENLRLTRTIRVPLGGSTVYVDDVIENAGWQASPLMLLYHLNFGWPLVDAGTEIVYAANSPIEPRDADARAGLSGALMLDAPTPGYREQCFFHDPKTDDNGWASVRLENRALPLSVTVGYDTNTLPWFTEWKMMGQGEYVCGLEPANCRVFGRALERDAGRLQTLASGEMRTFRLQMTLSRGA